MTKARVEPESFCQSANRMKLDWSFRVIADLQEAQFPIFHNSSVAVTSHRKDPAWWHKRCQHV